MKGWFSGFYLTFYALMQIESIAESIDGESSFLMPGRRLHKPAVDDINVTMNSGLGPSKQFVVKMRGEYFWKLIKTKNNTQNSQYVFKKVIVKKRIKISYSGLSRHVARSAFSAGVDVNVEGLYNIFDIQLKGRVETELDRLYETLIYYKNETQKISKFKVPFLSHPHAIGKLYQLTYKGPGVTLVSSTSTILSTNHNGSSVPIKCYARQIPMIKHIFLVKSNNSSDMPEGLVTETLSQSPDINNGFDGDFVWLKPLWTTFPDEAVNRIKFMFKIDKKDRRTRDHFGYFKIYRNDTFKKRIKRIGLFRNRDYEIRREYGWDDCTRNINKRRGGDSLRLCWKYINVN